jgi:SAM-dependent methyltransferase
VLDVGCGGGRTAIAAARAVGPTGAVVGADLSAPLSALAERRAQESGVANVTFRVVDMQTDAVAGGPFDVALSQFGVMFFAQPVVAFANIRAHLAPGGRIAFACWQPADRNPWFFAAAIADLLPPPPEPAPGASPAGPFAFGDPEHVTGILRAAGFGDSRVTAYEIAVDAPPDTLVDDSQLLAMGVAPERLAQARAAVAGHMRQFDRGPTQSRFPLAFQIVEANNA